MDKKQTPAVVEPEAEAKPPKEFLRLHEEPAWRWRKAQEFVANKQKPSNWRVDPDVKLAYAYLMKVDKNNPRTMQDASRRWPALYDAFQMWDNKDNAKGSKWIFEAAVMARVPVERMAEYLQIDVRTLELYERIFFDVRQHLDHVGWVNANILHTNNSVGVTSDDVDCSWKAIAYNGGWDIIRSIWEFGNASSAVQDFMAQTFRHKLMIGGLGAASALNINSFNSVDVMRLVFDLMKHDVETGAQVSRDKTQSAMGGVLRSVKLTVVSALEDSPRVEPRRQSQLPPPDIFESSRRTKADEEIAKLAEATIEEVKKDG